MWLYYVIINLVEANMGPVPVNWWCRFCWIVPGWRMQFPASSEAAAGPRKFGSEPYALHDVIMMLLANFM